MVTVERSLVDRFNEEGYVIYRGLLDWDEDLKPVWEEYTARVDGLIERFHREGRISNGLQGLPFGERLGRMLAETDAANPVVASLSNIAHLVTGRGMVKEKPKGGLKGMLSKLKKK